MWFDGLVNIIMNRQLKKYTSLLRHFQFKVLPNIWFVNKWYIHEGYNERSCMWFTCAYMHVCVRVHTHTLMISLNQTYNCLLLWFRIEISYTEIIVIFKVVPLLFLQFVYLETIIKMCVYICTRVIYHIWQNFQGETFVVFMIINSTLNVFPQIYDCSH